MGAIRVPTPAEQAELGKIAAPNKVAPSPATPSESNSPKPDKPPVKGPGGEPITHKMGRVRVGPATAEPTTKPATPTKDEKAK